MNTLATILDDAGKRAEVQKWLIDRWLMRQEYDYGMATAGHADEMRLPENGGQYLEASRKKHFRRPQKLDHNNPLSDPASGQTLAEEKVTVPIDFIQDYVGIGMRARITSRHDLEEWADDDLVVALQKRQHELCQNAIKVGRYKPGKWAADGTASVAFDTTAEATVTMDGVEFTFQSGKKMYAGGKTAFNALEENDAPTMADFGRMYVYLSMKGAPKIKGRYVARISAAYKEVLMQDPDFKAAVLAWNGKGIADNEIVDFKGWHFLEDDLIFAENFANENVRVENGPIHTAFCYGAHAYARMKLGGKSPLKPTFKVQDTTITGVLKTIGYTIPGQWAVINPNWCGCIMGVVPHWDPDMM